MSSLTEHGELSRNGEAVSRPTMRRGVTVAGAVVAALGLWVLAAPIAGIDLAVELGGSVRHLGPGTVATASMLAGLAAWLLLAVLERFDDRPRRTWTIIASAVLPVSLIGPLGSAANTASTVTLIGMHLAVAVVLIPGLRRTAQR